MTLGILTANELVSLSENNEQKEIVGQIVTFLKTALRLTKQTYG